MKKMLIVGGTIIALFIAFNLMSNVVNNPKVHGEKTIVAKKVIKQGSGWYVNDDFLDKSFKHGSRNPKVKDKIHLELDSKERIIGWKVQN